MIGLKPRLRRKIRKSTLVLSEHPHRQRFLPLFDRLRCFGELEQRLAALPSVIDQQIVFEIFIVAFFAVQRVRLVRDIWPLALAPSWVQQRLPGAFATDMPIQCVWELPGGALGVCRLQFQAGRQPLARKEVQAFLEATQRLPQRALLTNSDLVPAVLERQDDLLLLRGSDFDRLDERELQQIRRWLLGAGPPTDRLILPPSQEQLCQQVVTSLRGAGRVTVVPPLGMGLYPCLARLMELAGGQQSVLCLIPSYGHIQQLLWYWNRYVSWSAISVMVCHLDSPSRRGQDGPRAGSCNVPMVRELASAGERLGRFLQGKFHGSRVVLTTGRSLVELMTWLKTLTPATSFDLAIACQAERLLDGRDGGADELFLSSPHLLQRLIWAGIVRHEDRYAFGRSHRGGEPKLLFDCDSDPQRYGAVLRPQPEPSRSIRIVLVLISSDMLAADSVLSDDHKSNFWQANLRAIHHAVRRYQVNRLVLLGDQEEMIPSIELESFAQMTLHSRDSMALRQTTIERFNQAAGPALLSIQGRIGQGMDSILTPIHADMVLSSQPNSDQDDLLAATAMLARSAAGRDHRGEGISWLLVPVLITKQDDMSLTTALEQAD
ncbi:MAG: hypothetical protein HQL60_04410, partial [Magnetococcales bacterium]|nr:hypothetical protein [Magnetococcales bacterium]